MVSVVAWAGLVAADLLIHVAGFRRLHHIARVMPVRSRGSAGPHTVGDTRASVDRAARLYFKRTDEPLLEYACHEGNVGMFGILSGARKLEAQ